MALPTSAMSAVMEYLLLKTSSRTDRRSRDAERRRVTDLALDALQGTRHEFDGHERRPREGRAQTPGAPRREAEPGVELGVPEDHDDAVSRLLGQPQALTDE